VTPLSDEPIHPSARRVVDALRARGVEATVRQFDVPTKTAADAAAALGCDVGAIASTLVFMLDGEPVVVIKSGAFRVDVERLRIDAGATSARQATPDEVRVATGQPIGGVSPVGWPRELLTFIDDRLDRYEVVWAACGTPHAVFASTYDELMSLTGAAPLSLRPH